MSEFKIKSEFKDRVVGFNNSSLPLGKRSDIWKLAEIAVKSKDKSLLNLFEKVPSVKAIEKAKEAAFMEATKPQPQAEDVTDQPNQKADNGASQDEQG